MSSGRIINLRQSFFFTCTYFSGMYINLTRLPDLALFRYVCLGSFILAFEVDTKKVEVYWGSKYSSKGQQSFFTAQNFVNFQISKNLTEPCRILKNLFEYCGILPYLAKCCKIMQTFAKPCKIFRNLVGSCRFLQIF